MINKAYQNGNEFMGIILNFVVILIFSIQDIVSKFLIMEVEVVQFIFVRFAVSFILVLLFVIHIKGSVNIKKLYKSKNPKLQILRCAVLTIEIGIFAYGLGKVSLVDAHAIFAVTPLLITVLAVFFLKEKVSLTGVLMLLLGFIGALIIIQPGGNSIIGIDSIYTIVAVALYSAYIVITRKIGLTDSPSTSNLYLATTGLVIYAIPGIYFWQADITIVYLLLSISLGFISISSHSLLTVALSMIDASKLQPYHYLLLVLNAVTGYYIFNEIPSYSTIIGSVIVTISGLYMVFHQKNKKIIKL